METANTNPNPQCVAFAGTTAVAAGHIAHVAKITKEYLDLNQSETVLIFDSNTSEQIEIDFRGTAEEVIARLQDRYSYSDVASGEGLPLNQESSKGPGRPKLGVVAREITLLPRHWEWLQQQPGGASVVLRKLVEEARRTNLEKDKLRVAMDATYKFMHAMAGDLPNFEEATRALFGRDLAKFEECIANWPHDLKKHIELISKSAFDDSSVVGALSVT
ncbi:MAG TPA: DUF2239 family protein [Drouetiella sp.]